jgi:small subunit ribosomal protein S3
MGQKVNPICIRLGIIRNEDSIWYAGSKDYANYLNADLKLRVYLEKKLFDAAVSRIKIERPAKNARVTIYSARPGTIIGRKGENIDVLRKEISNFMGVPVYLSVEEVTKPDIDAKLVANNIARQLENRAMFRKVMKKSVQNAKRAGALGIKICVSGRLGGSEIARCEWNREGRVPLHTFRADIDYGLGEAKTTYGIVGVKVWIFKGEIMGASGEDKISKSEQIKSVVEEE